MKAALGILLVVMFSVLGAAAQSDRITTVIDSNQVVVLPGNVHPNAQPKYDQGPVDPSMAMDYVTMQMKPSAAQQAALNRLLAQQQDRSSPNYHKWLTPEQYADQFGLSQSDIEKIVSWLQMQGFSIVQSARGRDWIAFTGTAEMVENTFRTQLHFYNVNGEMHFANATPLSIPQALNGIVVGFRGLHDFSLTPMGIGKILPPDIFPSILRPFYNDGAGDNFMAPGDVATIYDITPLYNAGTDGTGQKLVVVGQTDIQMSDIEDFRSGFGLSNNDPQVVTVGSDPGTTGDLSEADLDLEWSGAVARNATIIYVTSKISAGGVFNSASYAIDQDLAPVISMSYGGCESMNASFIPTNEPTMQKANTEGITFIASSGDSGAAGCDSDQEASATQGLAVNYPASSPEVTAVGGTEFNGDVSDPSKYWGNSGSNGGTALSYIPETAWNDTVLNGTLSASAGGASSCVSTGCASGFPKPSWQAGTGVPNDKVRDVPDVAMDASADHDGFILCTGGSCSSGVSGAVTGGTIFGGTSVSAPVFAGIVTLLNQQLNNAPPAGVGNINPTLYKLAQTPSNGVFHDITTGNNIVPCTQGSKDCPRSAPFQFGYNATAGYDQVTGLGSVDASLLVGLFSGGSSTTTTLTSSLNPAGSGTSVTFTAKVTGNGSSTPTGVVTFNDGATKLGTGTLSSGQAQFSTAALSIGGHSITAAYGGDTKNLASTSAILTETILAVGGAMTNTVVMSSSNPSTFGVPLTFTATVTTTNNSVPLNTVTFQDGTTPLGFATVNQASANSGTANFIIPNLTPGTHSITGLYSGDSPHNNASSTSSPAIQQVITKAATTTDLSTNLSSSTVFSQPVTLTAIVNASPYAVATGTVTFNDTFKGVPTTLGTGSLNSLGIATLATTNLTTPGSHSITAVYGGDTNYLTSTSSASNLTVNAATFTFGALPASQTVASGTSASYTLTVTPNGSYTSQISFSCAFSPSTSATCNANPVTPGANSTTTTLTISGAQPAIAVRAANTRVGKLPPLYAFWTPMGIAGLVLLGSGKRPKVGYLKYFLLAGGLLLVALGLFGCGGGSSSTPPPQQTPQTYTITITATAPATASGSSAAVTQMQTVSLTVNP